MGYDLVDNLHIYQRSDITEDNALKIFSPDEYEEVILDWVEGYLKKRLSYVDVERLGGKGDKGRDVIATYDKARLKWDNYQCKHYAAALNDNDLKKEIAKLCFYTFKKEYPLPQNYYFLAPKGLQPSTHDLIYYKKTELKEQIIRDWSKLVKSLLPKEAITKASDIQSYIESEVDFNIFSHMSSTTFLEQFRQTNYFAYRFKQRIKMNPDIKISAPEQIDLKKEKTYVDHIIDAYSENSKTKLDADNLPEKYDNHFKRQRRFFYCAAATEKITRDACRNEKPFTDLKEDIYNSIIDTVEDESHADGYQRLNQCLSNARSCHVSHSNEIHEAVDNSAQQGICHYLANENKVKWTKRQGSNEHI